jgi:glycerol uptake facilitator-like aquaporin
VPGYLIAQIAGAYVGVACAHLMFGLPLFSASQHARTGTSQIFSEWVATFGLLCAAEVHVTRRSHDLIEIVDELCNR